MDQETEGRVVAIRPESPHESPPRYPAETEIERPGFAVHDDWFSTGGRQQPPGLYWHDWGRGEDPEPVDTWIAAPVRALALTSDEDGRSAGLLLRFRDHFGQWREWSMPLHLLKGSGDELRGELLDMGFRFNVRQARRFSEWLMQQHPRERLIAATRTGWHPTGDGRCFVLPSGTIGSDEVRHQSEHPGVDDFRQAGTLDGWRETVAQPCRGNPVLLLSVSAALAGPLLKVAELRDAGGNGLHLVGDSSQGKTTALQAAASVWGGPGFVRTWRATANGLEAAAAALNDTALILDEISECDSREVGAIVYALANGNGKQRARREGGSRQAARWRVVALSTGERSLSAHMAEGGGRIKAGQSVRLLDVPATRREHGAFDQLHGHAHGGALADAIKQAAEAHYGHAGTAFVRYLLDCDHDLPGLLKDTREVGGFDASEGLERRAAGVFALVGLAGELASEAGITGWAEGEALDAATAAFDWWRAAKGTGRTEQQQILDAVADFLARHGDARFSPINGEPRPVQNRAGYWRDDPEGRVYLLHSAALQEAAAGFDTVRALDALESAGWLAEREGRARSVRVRPQGQPLRRFYAVRPVEDGDGSA
ncbi:DUF927 domain-containing protein [Halorhodospira sp. 9622]|uniref:DUF927 domain-containing protein n=1 Tax=Halorhodospira sp. 9622 TaxID=2899136 RepID=UPI001EE7E18C|nr:DUF927 domain-containing protein [Halorhodospira sp. 9622]MCG5537386.1 DUF927 domain-containing protein [Halorhodospira sp. 9622]